MKFPKRAFVFTSQKEWAAELRDLEEISEGAFKVGEPIIIEVGNTDLEFLSEGPVYDNSLPVAHLYKTATGSVLHLFTNQ